ncbi:hypothetical protein CGCA056_v003180 [Colletotrichum aenigma]|uniref:uncharacterized protein n=1 Tax=Colletotrichum aenigma TaxID=1215731 RepID=UPI001872B2B0|nr:uncharacterized protein CGCA056_v003180 [Colletotrichum aenigma]KAF5526416.1 hypothetical protein CGCA056_v003180 [Colletotrichum aenigma]
MGTAYLMRRRAPPALPSRWRLRWCFAGIPEAYHLVRYTTNTTCLPVSQRAHRQRMEPSCTLRRRGDRHSSFSGR